MEVKLFVYVELTFLVWHQGPNSSACVNHAVIFKFISTEEKSQTVCYYIEPQIIQMKSKISRHFASQNMHYCVSINYKIP